MSHVPRAPARMGPHPRRETRQRDNHAPSPRREVVRPTTKHARKTPDREKVIAPTPEEWAEQQLINAPRRSAAWAKRVARIYCLDIAGDQEETAV